MPPTTMVTRVTSNLDSKYVG